MAASPTELEQHVSDVVLGALKKDDAGVWFICDSGRAEIISMLASFTSRQQAQVAARALMRCALYVHNQLCCKRAAVDLMNIFAVVGPAPERRRSLLSVDDPRRKAMKRKLKLVPPPGPEAENEDGTEWWQVLA